jgi:hypothetical protein
MTSSPRNAWRHLKIWPRHRNLEPLAGADGRVGVVGRCADQVHPSPEVIHIGIKK